MTDYQYDFHEDYPLQIHISGRTSICSYELEFNEVTELRERYYRQLPFPLRHPGCGLATSWREVRKTGWRPSPSLWLTVKCTVALIWLFLYAGILDRVMYIVHQTLFHISLYGNFQTPPDWQIRSARCQPIAWAFVTTSFGTIRPAQGSRNPGGWCSPVADSPTDGKVNFFVGIEEKVYTRVSNKPLLRAISDSIIHHECCHVMQFANMNTSPTILPDWLNQLLRGINNTIHYEAHALLCGSPMLPLALVTGLVAAGFLCSCFPWVGIPVVLLLLCTLFGWFVPKRLKMMGSSHGGPGGG
ncbi:MAG: hypothetical protein R3E01_15165 [Pirellulaceae bacterium]|nr:hypothetical protein [Planctomycetales bacterium]